jgi:hypothetical protein
MGNGATGEVVRVRFTDVPTVHDLGGSQERTLMPPLTRQVASSPQGSLTGSDVARHREWK